MTAESHWNLYAATNRPALRPAELADWLAGVLTALLGLAALLVGARRLAGALEQPLGPAGLLAAGVLMAAAAATVHAARDRRRGSRAGRLLLGSLISASLVVLAAGVTLGGTNHVALGVFWSILAGEECWAWRRTRRRAGEQGNRGTGEQEIRRTGDQENGRDSPLPLVGDGLGTWADSAGAPPPAAPAAGQPAEPPWASSNQGQDQPQSDVLQQLMLSRSAAGGQRLAGWLRMPVAPGQRTGNLHVAFCPPFAKVPELVFEQVSGPACRVKAAQLLPYGVRLELKLATAATEADSVLLRFSASEE
jgi:hypothetical protein